MKKYLSFGGGISSTALLLLLNERREEFETIFVNHGGDYPETYEYVDYLRKQGFEITEIIPDVEGCSTIVEYCKKWRIKPLRQVRWCTVKFKVEPVKKYIKKPAIMYVGFEKGEEKRATHIWFDPDVEYKYPLIEMGFDRKKCIEIIQSAGLKIPPKSGCFFCPFKRPGEIRELYLKHPDLYQIAKQIEKEAKNQIPLIRDKPLEEWAMEKVPPLSAFLEVKEE